MSVKDCFLELKKEDKKATALRNISNIQSKFSSKDAFKNMLLTKPKQKNEFDYSLIHVMMKFSMKSNY